MRFIFLDLDDTILDFHRAERQALSQTLRHFHVDPTDAVLDRYHVLNRRTNTWGRVSFPSSSNSHCRRFRT